MCFNSSDTGHDHQPRPAQYNHGRQQWKFGSPPRDHPHERIEPYDDHDRAERYDYDRSQRNNRGHRGAALTAAGASEG